MTPMSDVPAPPLVSRGGAASGLFVAALLVLSNGPMFLVQERLLLDRGGFTGPVAEPLLVAVATGAIATVCLREAGFARSRLPRPLLVTSLSVATFVVWCVLSSLWSVNPDLTRPRALLYVGLAALAWLLADLEPRRLGRVVGWFAGLAVIASLVAVTLVSDWAVDRNGDWTGVFNNRNSFAPVCGLAIISLAPMAAVSRGRRRALLVAVCGCAVIGLLGAGSRTAWLAVCSAVGFASMIGWAGLRRRSGRSVVLPFVLVAAGAVSGGGAVARLWGESTFEQRRTMWRFAWEWIGDRPLHGHGWWSVWNTPRFTSLDALLQRGSAHNSFLDVWLGVGLVGFVCYVVIVATALGATIVLLWRRPSLESWFLTAMTTFLVVENLTESFVLLYSYNWVLILAVALRAGSRVRPGSGPRTPERIAAVTG